MKYLLDSIRKEDNNYSLKRKIINTSIIFIAGILLGLLSKWLDSRSFNNAILDYFDLGNFFSTMAIWLFMALAISIYSKSPKRASLNVFLFFLGMTISYHLYTVLFNGFNPKSYMMIWYGFTILSPLIAFITWYGKGTSKFSIDIDTIIIFVMSEACFNSGMWYFDFKGILYTITFIASLCVIYKDKMNLLISFVIGMFLSFILVIPFISG
jgi:hypothetical protein